MAVHLLPISDASLVKRSLGGEAEAFESLVLRYQLRGQAVARALGVAPSAVDDVLQESFLRAFRSLERLAEAEAFGPWFLGIVRNVARTHLRTAGRLTLTPDLDQRQGQPHLPLESRELHERVWEEVARLPGSVREAVFLYYYEGESTRKVARALGVSLTGVKNRLRRGRELLRRRLWRALGEALRDMIPSAREQRQTARRRSLVVLSLLSSSRAEGAAAGTEAATGASSVFLSAAEAAGALSMTTKKVGATIALCVLLFSAGFIGGSFSRPPADSPPAVSVARLDPDPGPPMPRPAAPSRPAPIAERPPRDDRPDAAAGVEEVRPAPTTGNVLVTVVHAAGDEPAVGIEVRLVPRHRPSPEWVRFFGRTDEHGQAGFEGLPPGRYVAGFDRAYPEGRWPTIEVATGETTETRLRVPEGILVEGIVVDGVGVAVAGADVLVSRDEFDGFSAHRVTTSGPDGTFSIDAVGSGRYVSARKDGYAPSSQHALRSEAGATIELRLVLPGAGSAVSGRILGPGGRGIPEARVMVGNRDIRHGSYAVPAAPFVTRSGADGTYSAGGLVPGPTPVVARVPGFAPKEETVLVEAGRVAALDLTLEPEVVVEGFVLAASGSPIEGANLRVGTDHPFVEGTDPLVTTTRSDAGGHYRLTGLAAGSITIDVSTDGHGKARPTIEAAAGETIELDIELAPPLEIRGRVVLADGTPLAGAGVQAAGLTYEQTGEDGRFVLANCADKEYRLEILEPRRWRIPCAVRVARPSDEEIEIVVREEDRSTATAEGTVIDADGRVVRGAKIRLWPIERRGQVRAESGFFGGFRAGPAPAGEYRVGVEADGWPRTWLENVTLESQTRVDIGKLRLVRPGWLRVEFTSAPAAHEGAYFGVFDREERCLVAVSLSSDPERREPLVPGRHRLVVRARSRGEAEVAREFEIAAGRETVVQIDIEGGDP